MPTRLSPHSFDAALAASGPGADGAAAALDPAQALNSLARGRSARVLRVVDHAGADGAADPIAERLRELGFVAGESVKMVASGPLGGEPLLVQVGFTRFALRKAEAARVRVSIETR